MRRRSGSGWSRSAWTMARCKSGRWLSPAQLASGAQSAIRWTKQTLNNWYRAQAGIFDASLAYEFYGFGGPDAIEGLAAVSEKRPAHFTGPTAE